jgi:hypothetical protein
MGGDLGLGEPWRLRERNKALSRCLHGNVLPFTEGAKRPGTLIPVVRWRIGSLTGATENDVTHNAGRPTSGSCSPSGAGPRKANELPHRSGKTSSSVGSMRSIDHGKSAKHGGCDELPVASCSRPPWRRGSNPDEQA